MPDAAPPDRGPGFAIVPVGTLATAQSRLGQVLDAADRRARALRRARATVAAAVASDGMAETLVITPAEVVRRLATELGARSIRQRDGGLNRGIDIGRAEAAAAGASAVLILPIDLPD